MTNTTHSYFKNNKQYCKECDAELVVGPLADIYITYKCPNERWVVFLGKVTRTHFVRTHDGHKGRSGKTIETTDGIFPESSVFSHKPVQFVVQDEMGDYTEWV